MTWLRYRRLLRALVEDACRRRQPLDRRARAVLKGQARAAANATGRHRLLTPQPAPRVHQPHPAVRNPPP